MTPRIPKPLTVEHEELHAELVKLTRSRGKVGEVARAVAAVLHPHFVKEEAYALPPLGLLAALAAGPPTPEMRAVLPMTDRLRRAAADAERAQGGGRGAAPAGRRRSAGEEAGGGPLRRGADAPRPQRGTGAVSRGHPRRRVRQGPHGRIGAVTALATGSFYIQTAR